MVPRDSIGHGYLRLCRGIVLRYSVPLSLPPPPTHTHIMSCAASITGLTLVQPQSSNHSINKSTDSLPVSLAFVKRSGKSDQVLGFSKISAVQGINEAGLVESVVLREKDRGKGLGRVLMNLTEEYGHRLGIKTMYLSTKDKEGFYSRLGYEKCQPVLSLGANAHRVPESMLRHFMAAPASTKTQSLSSDEQFKSTGAMTRTNASETEKHKLASQQTEKHKLASL
ncbi:N-acetyltransferase 6 [Elysia marginata]|uniref:N-acetyltransferase 6 n=1 Tax=Elysia marginata TaxID=1093978 RepID=A0AAV4H601_9GAST|nr:N-acetyltransferase 6 [Elysia marginata]